MLASALVLGLSLAGCLGPCGLDPCGVACRDDAVAKIAPAPLDVAGAAAIGGLAGELAVVGLALTLSPLLDKTGLSPSAAGLVLVSALMLAWPIGSAGYAAERAEVRGADPWAVGLVTLGTSAALFGGGLGLVVVTTGVPLAPSPSFEQVGGAALGALVVLAASSVGGGLAAGVTTAMTLE